MQLTNKIMFYPSEPKGWEAWPANNEETAFSIHAYSVFVHVSNVYTKMMTQQIHL